MWLWIELGVWVCGYGCGIWGVGMWDVGYGVWDVGCGMWGVGCGMWGVRCGIRYWHGYGCGRVWMGVGVEGCGVWKGVGVEGCGCGRVWVWEGMGVCGCVSMGHHSPQLGLALGPLLSTSQRWLSEERWTDAGTCDV